ncbi:hypothetical protein BP5796_12899 [Coleophoma crateriformis]|uniref:SnoaL-like domain-containing protein n=1 Tax=Coleophoma crateriformis TaxID=565419 RepID=A0A3D8Q4U5_9HELO|nr:hypothetical protein BP5796_12899 [Coleophoma crateriformis]
MVLIPSALLALLSSTALALPQPTTDSKPALCLSDSEANSISKSWLAIWDTGYLTKKSQLKNLVTKDVLSFDGTYGPPTVGLDALYAAATYVDPLVTNVLQYPETAIHNCDTISVRWGYSAVSTSNAPNVPAGTPIFLEGIEILQVELSSRLIFNATSSADWVLLATQLGETVNL